MSKIAPCLWFDGQAEDAANFYVTTFRHCGQEAAMGDVMLTQPRADPSRRAPS